MIWNGWCLPSALIVRSYHGVNHNRHHKKLFLKGFRVIFSYKGFEVWWLLRRKPLTKTNKIPPFNSYLLTFTSISTSLNAFPQRSYGNAFHYLVSKVVSYRSYLGYGLCERKQT